MLVRVDLFLVAFSAIKCFGEVLSGDHDGSTIENLFVSVDDDVLQKEGTVTGLLQSQIVKSGFLNFLFDHLEVNNKIDNNEHTDETEAEDDSLLVVLLILGKLDGSFFKLVDIISLIFFLLFFLMIFILLILLDQWHFLHRSIH